MIRRRRRNREIAFGLDSFLDIIANVIGVIIRMILVVWVGARSYHELQFQPKPEPVEPPVVIEKKIEAPPNIEDPLEREIAKHRQQLQQAQDSLLEHLRLLPPLAAKHTQVKQQIAAIAAQQKALQHNADWLKAAAGQEQHTAHTALVSLAELQQRGDKLKKEIAQLAQLPVAKKAIYYRTPVSKQVETEELIFECQGGRVTFVDVAALSQQMIDDATARLQELKLNGKLEGVTRQIGAFRLRYVLQRDQVDALLGGGKVGVVKTIEPQAALRGETLAQALQPNSEFRQIVDHADPKQTVITFAVYPDSFALFRQLRDHLYQRNIEVAGRPLPHGNPITFSPDGTASRSQ